MHSHFVQCLRKLHVLRVQRRPDPSNTTMRSLRRSTLISPCRLADSVDILLMKSSLESLPSVQSINSFSSPLSSLSSVQISDSGILLESGKSSQQPVPLKSPTESRSVHFPLLDLSNEFTSMSVSSANPTPEASSNFATALNVGLSNTSASNPIIKSVRSPEVDLFCFSSPSFVLGHE